MNYAAQLTELPKKHEFMICFDSDGCVFDTMEIKHKECFCPAYIKHMNLQGVSRYAREVWDFVNLYSRIFCFFACHCNALLGASHRLKPSTELLKVTRSYFKYFWKGGN